MPSPLTREICRSFVEQHLFEPSQTAKPGEPGFVGIELEVFPYILDIKSEKGKRPVPLFGDQDSLMHALVHASEHIGGIAKYWHPDINLKGYNSQIERIAFPDGDRFLFEPGGQIEISTAPCRTMDTLQAHLSSKLAVLDAVTQQSNIRFAQFGTNPWFHVDEIGNQIHKPRYRALEKYFDDIGPYGKQMMLQTGSLHINLDLGNDHTIRIKRILAANLLVPFVTAIFAHSPVIEGKTTGHKSYRSFLWQHLDARRTGILPMQQLSKTLREENLIDTYMEFALKAPLMYISALGDQVLPLHYTMEYIMTHPIEGFSPDATFLANHFSLLFPEVRLKGYLELRSVDAPPAGWEMVPAIFYCGLLYSDQHLDQLLGMLLPLTSRIGDLYREATFGLASDEIFALSKDLVHLAIAGFSSLPDDFKKDNHTDQLITFFERFTRRRKTFADAYLETLSGK